jgi:aminoglycoside phosphotransferase (APT) family kinase protein
VVDLDGLATRLEAYLRVRADDHVRVAALEPMTDGHAGLTYGFEMRSAGACARPFVLKVAPPAGRRSGSTDLYRQAPLLRALHAGGQPVPAIPWAEAEDDVLGAPFLIMERLPGRTFIVWEPAPELVRGARGCRTIWLETARAMARLHRFNWRQRLPDWEAPTTLVGELDRWSALLKHTQDGSWLRAARALEAALRADLPEPRAIGVIHGDFQPGNLLFRDGRLKGVIDWDLAAIGPQGLDVGWLLMMADAQSWADGWKPFDPPARSDLLEAYWAAGGTERARLGWHQAFAHFRLAAIAGLNLKLHRDGRRPDPTWEKFAPSISVLLRRGPELL